FAYWRGLMVVCLLLPLCQPWQRAATAGDAAPALPAAFDEGGHAFASPAAALPARWPIDQIALGVLFAGVAARGVWLLAGGFSLRRLRRTATPLAPLPAWVHDAEQRVGAEAAVCVSDRVTGPITFGLFRPVILLPPNV